MRRARRGVVMTALAVAAVAARAQDRPPVFHGSAAAISVHVSVRDRNRPVGGLTATDFLLMDNGVRQTVQSISVGAMPIDVTIALDASGSVTGSAVQQFGRDVQAVAARLGQEDRLRVLAYSTTVEEVRPMAPASAASPPITIKTGGATAFFHAIIASLARRVEPGRPHLVVVLGDGADNISFFDDADVVAVARRSDSVLHVVLRPGSSGGYGRGWLPFQPPRMDRLRAAADETGGQLDALRADAPSTDLLARAIEEFKTGYVLWYTPAAVSRTGWHDITVRLRSGGYTVNARRGYFAG